MVTWYSDGCGCWPAYVCLCGCELVRVNRGHNCIKGWSFLASTIWGIDMLSVCVCLWDLGSGVSCKPPLAVRWVIQPAECGDLCGQRWFTASCHTQQIWDTHRCSRGEYLTQRSSHMTVICVFHGTRTLRAHRYLSVWSDCIVHLCSICDTFPITSKVWRWFADKPMAILAIHCADTSPPIVELSPLSCRPWRDACFQQWKGQQ